MNGKVWPPILTDQPAKDRVAGFHCQARIQPGDRRLRTASQHHIAMGATFRRGAVRASLPGNTKLARQASAASSTWPSAMAGIARKALPIAAAPRSGWPVRWACESSGFNQALRQVTEFRHISRFH